MNNDTPETLAEIHWQACGLACPALNGDRCKKDAGESCSGPKFDTAAAEILWLWSLGSGQDEDCGDAQYGDGWHALFRAERAVLHTDSRGFVSAWRVPESEDLDKVWEEIESRAAHPEDECVNGSPTCTSDDPCVICYDA